MDLSSLVKENKSQHIAWKKTREIAVLSFAPITVLFSGVYKCANDSGGII